MCEDENRATRIMVVDDDDNFSGLLRDKLEDEGYIVEVFGSREQAKAVFMTQQHDIVLMDLNIEDDDEIAGLLLSEQLLAINNFVKIIMITNYSEVPIAVYAMKIGVYSFVGKEPADVFWDDICPEVKQAVMKRNLEKQEADVRRDIISLIPNLEGNVKMLKSLAERWSGYHDSVEKFKQAYTNEEHKNRLRELVSAMRENHEFLE